MYVDKAVNIYTFEEIGLATINDALFKLNNDPKLWDALGDMYMVMSLFIVLIFAIKGLMQLIKEKSLKKVDKDILSFGILFGVLAVFWIIFDYLFIVNYRPIPVDGKLEGSYPSTHVLIVTYTLLSATTLIKPQPNVNKKALKLFYITVYSCVLFLIIMTGLSRMLANMHWFTDVLAGALLGSALYFGSLKLNTILEVKKND